ncbi:hypothetical protein QVD17_41928 [Tagetes erecta]|uniref:Uncharacterized protein n=1 Tax=Tagetes erecta TaxID=13708 RepID=A0AAD8JN91_TARER|nr:hypothetical protein QVD17_41928 [Tagetes erecta]
MTNLNNDAATNPSHLERSFKKFSHVTPLSSVERKEPPVCFNGLKASKHTFLNSMYPENLKVRHVTSVLQKGSLTWWNEEKRKRGVEAAMALSWDEDNGENLAYTNRVHELSLLVPHLITPWSRAIEKYIGGLPMEIQDIVLGSNPTTLQDDIRLASQLIDNHMKDESLVRKGNKKDSG